MFKNLKSKLLGSQPKVLMIIGLGILAYMALTVGKTVYNNIALNRKIADIKIKVEDMQAQNDKLQAMVLYYKTDSFKEKEARLKLNLVKPGESVVNVPISETPEVVAQELPTPVVPNPIKWWNKFFAE